MSAMKEQAPRAHVAKEAKEQPVRTRKAAKELRTRPLTRNDALIKLIGIGESKEADGFSWRKHELDI